MNHNKEAKSLTFRRGSEVSQEYWCMNQRVMPMRVSKAFGDGGGVAGRGGESSGRGWAGCSLGNIISSSRTSSSTSLSL